MIFKTEFEKFEPYITKDGSIIRELMHPSVHGNPNQSLAEATVPAGGKTLLHKHRITEEIYHPSFTSCCCTASATARSPFRFAQEDEFAKMRLRTM